VAAAEVSVGVRISVGVLCQVFSGGDVAAARLCDIAMVGGERGSSWELWAVRLVDRQSEESRSICSSILLRYLERAGDNYVREAGVWE